MGGLNWKNEARYTLLIVIFFWCDCKDVHCFEALPFLYSENTCVTSHKTQDYGHEGGMDVLRWYYSSSVLSPTKSDLWGPKKGSFVSTVNFLAGLS